MRCEQCHKEEAVVHVTLISPNGDEKHNLCESCYRESEIPKKIASAGLTCDGPTGKYCLDNGLES